MSGVSFHNCLFGALSPQSSREVLKRGPSPSRPKLVNPTRIAFPFHPQKLPLAQECNPKLHQYMLILES